MRLETYAVEQYTKLACNNGEYVRDFSLLISASIRRTVTNDNVFTMVVLYDPEIVFEKDTIFRVTNYRTGEVTEWQFREQSVDELGIQTTITCDPWWIFLTDARPLRTVYVNGVVNFHLFATLSPIDAVDQMLLAHRAVDGYPFLSRGTIAPTVPVDIDMVAPTPQAFLIDLVRQCPKGTYWMWERNGEVGYILHILVGLVGPTVFASVGTDVQALTRNTDVQPQISEVFALGTDTGNGPPVLGNARWKIDVLSGTTVQLMDGSTNTSPFTEIDQAKDWYLSYRDRTFGPITASTLNGICTVPSTTGLVDGKRVGLCLDANGTPVYIIPSPSAIAAIGNKTGNYPSESWRGEYQMLENPDFRDGEAPWEPVNGGLETGVAVAKADLDKTLVFATDGTRPPGTSTATPFTVKGLVPSVTNIYRGDRIVQAGAIITATATVLPSNLGAFTVPVTALPVSFNDDDPITLRRKELATGAVVHGMPKGSGILMLDVGDADLAFRWVSFARCDQYGGAFTPGDVFATGPGGVTFETNWYAMYVHEDDDEVIVVRTGTAGSGPFTYVPATNATAVAPHRMRVYVPDKTITGSVMLPFIWNHSGTNLPPWLFAPGGGSVMNLIGPIVGGGGSGPSQYIEFDVTGLPASCDLTGITGYVADLAEYGGAQVLVHYPPSSEWSGTFNLTWRREARTLRFNGSHSSGATSASFKPIAALSLRNWVNTDQLRTIWGSYGVGSSASWDVDGYATLACSIPGGVTLKRGEKVWSNFHGTGQFDTMIVVAATVVGPASSVTVCGNDAFKNTTTEVEPTPAIACYRLPEDSTFEIVGNVLIAAQNVTADGAGKASFALMGVNANAVPNDSVLTLVRPPMLVDGDSPDGYVLRTMCPSGTPGPSTPAWESAPIFVRVPAGSTIPFTVYGKAHVTPEATLSPGEGPIVGIFSDSNVLLNHVSLPSSITPSASPTEIELLTHATIDRTQFITIRVYGGSTTDYARWCAFMRLIAYIGVSEDVPFTLEGLANSGWFDALRYLQARQLPLRTITLLRRTAKALRQSWEDAATLGALIVIDGTSLSAQCVSFTEDLLDVDGDQMQLETESERLTRLLGATT